MKRRDLLKLPVFAGGAGMLLDACAPNANDVIPILIPEEPIVVGAEEWIPSTCSLCASHCGIRVRKTEGRLTKIEGRADHPLSQGGLCAAGQALPQSFYHPERLKAPLLRAENGSGELEPASWPDVMTRLREVFGKLGDDSTLTIISGELSGPRRMVLERLAASFPNTQWLQESPFAATISEREQARLLGENASASPRLDQMRYVVSLGADPLGGAESVYAAKSITAMRHATGGVRGKWVEASPHMSLTAASADEWIPVRSHSEIWLALGLASVLIRDGNYDRDYATRAKEFEAFVDWLDRSSPSAFANAADLSLSTMERLADELFSNQPAIALAGVYPANPVATRALSQAVSHLNALLGAYGESGCCFYGRDGEAPAKGIDGGDLGESLETLSEHVPEILWIVDTDPVFTCHDARFREWLEQIPVIIRVGDFNDDTTSIADIVLAESSPFERTDAFVSRHRGGIEAIGLTRPLLARSLYDTRPMGDVVIDLEKELGLEESVPWPDYQRFVREFTLSLRPENGRARSDEAWWQQVLQAGGFVVDTEQSPPASRRVAYRFEHDALESRFEAFEDARADSGSDSLRLHVYASAKFFDGRTAQLPFLQELADPLTDVRWDSVIEINPSTAERFGIRQGDRVRLTARDSQLETRAHLSPGLRPDTLALAAGQGHRSFTQYATGRGVNAFELIGHDAMDQLLGTAVELVPIDES